MRQLSDILLEKKKALGSFQKIGDRLGGISGQVIGKYVSDKIMPSLEFALKWKKEFNENLVELMLKDEIGETPMLNETDPKYDANIEVLKALVESQKETITLLREEVKRLKDETGTKNVKRTHK